VWRREATDPTFPELRYPQSLQSELPADSGEPANPAKSQGDTPPTR
jgi:hypothetical protein